MRITRRTVWSAAFTAATLTVTALITTAPPASAGTQPEVNTAPSYNGLALTPPMGFNDWAGFGCNSQMNESLFTKTADAMVNLGLKDLGYQYVNIDDCWMQHDRDANGNLQVDTSRFPHGMKWLGDYIHARGLKFGLYEDAGYKTCQGAAGMYGHFPQDSDLMASWGMDYLKLDYCYQPRDQYPGKTASQVAETVYSQASQALLDTGRPIVFSESAPAYVCCGGPDFNYELTWLYKHGNLWRYGTDISDNWQSVLRNYGQDNTPGLAQWAGPGHWNDADMLEIGNGGLSLTEEQTQFTLWSELASPLLLSTDLTKLTPAELSIIKNKDVIAIDQDPLGAQGTVVQSGTGYDVLAKPLANGDVAVVLFNKGDAARTITTNASTVGFTDDAAAYILRDLWTGRSTETAGVVSANVPAHGATILRVRPGTPEQAPPSVAMDLSGSPFKAGQATTVTASLTDNGRLPVQGVNVALDVPARWSIAATTPTQLPAVAPGDTARVTWSVTPDSLTPGGTYHLDTTARYSWPGGTPTGSAAEESFTAPYVADYASLADAYNNVGISDDSNPTPGNFDGDGDSYSEQELTRVGLAPGATVTYQGATFTWPDAPAGQPDNVAGGGRSIAFSGSGSALAFLGADAYNNPGMTVAITYTDGTVQQFPLSFPNWSSGASTAVARMNYRNTPSGPANFGVPYGIYYQSVPLLAGKQVAVVTLPQSSSVHVFAMGVKP
jgi:alpha-galactosidase